MEKNFDPNLVSQPNGNYFALPFSVEESRLVILSVPWDVTTSYGRGCAQGPDAIVEASSQVDLHDYHNPEGYKAISTYPISDSILVESTLLARDAEKIIAHLEEGGSEQDEVIQKRLQRVNAASERLNGYVYDTSRELLEQGKFVALVGGDHSTPLGLMKAVGEKHGDFGILHIDAHADLRQAYEGFTYSHASIMYNALREIPSLKKLVQTGIRDYCKNEAAIMRNDPRVETFTDYRIQEEKMCGKPWNAICREIVAQLPQSVYVSFDIDGLSPDLCPSTGTPVPGGLTFHEAVHLVRSVIRSGRRIIGFDLTEVAPSKDEENQWDANVGARLLFKLCNLALL